VFKRIHETDVKVLDQTYGVNIRGVWLGIKYAAAQFLKQEPLTTGSATAAGGGSGGSRGWIINMASVLGSVGLAGASTYCASKGAVLQLTKAAALEYAADGVHVNAVQPGFTDTHILEAMFEKGGRDPVAAHLTGLHPLGRLGRPADIAKMCVFLAGPGASWITGGHFAVDGGYLAQ
jgi:NAD(P)-dependent dehydrogenase (short-subunit alcohol dehydrogenase family)